MPRRIALGFLAALCVALAPVLRSSEPTPAPSLITASDLLKVRQVESPALSPDGKRVVYVLRSMEPKPDAKDDWTYRTQLWIADTDGQTPPRQLTFGSANNSNPVWSPQGDRVAFVRSADKEKPQIYLLPINGGEAQPLTKLETGATNPRWSPDGAKLLFSTSLSYAQLRDVLEKSGKSAAPTWSDEKPGRKPNDTANWGLKPADKAKDESAKKPEASPDGSLQAVREWLAKNEADANPRVMDRLNFLAEGDLAVEPTFTRYFTIEAKDGAAPVAVTAGFEGYVAASWLADGKGLVCVGPRDPKIHPDRDRLSSLFIVDLTTGTAKILLEEPGCNYGEPTVSPDGKWIAYTVRTGGELTFEQPVVAIISAAGGTPKVLTPGLDRLISGLKWSSDSQQIYFITTDHGRFPLRRVAVDKTESELLTVQADWGVQAFDLTAGSLVQVITQPANPWELHAATTDGKISKALTTHNSSWLKNRKLSPYEGHRLVNGDGITVDYWTIKPANFDEKKKYPLLVEIHGGPSAMWGPGESTMWFEFQFFAARGYAIMFSNPRGSGGYGRDFQRANYRDWGIGPSSDVLAAASFVAKESWIDADRQVVTGGSYGGYLTAWIVGHDHRFKAAVAQRGVYELSTFFGEGNAWFLLPLYWGGFPWQREVRQLLDRDSPLTYVENIRTPLLIQHGDVDFRTGVVQSQMLYKSLKQLGRDVEYVRYPRATHELSRSGEPKQRIDTLVRYEEFFRRYIGEN